MRYLKLRHFIIIQGCICLISPSIFIYLLCKLRLLINNILISIFKFLFFLLGVNLVDKWANEYASNSCYYCINIVIIIVRTYK